MDKPLEQAERIERGIEIPHAVLLPSGQTRTPTPLQIRAVENLTEQHRNGERVNKGQALRDAGYSDVMSEQPSRVFGSPTIIAIMDKMGLSEDDLASGHKYLLNAQRGEHMVFPPFREVWETEEKEEKEDENVEMKNGVSKAVGERMTDEQIRDFIQSFGGIVHRIVHGDMARHVYYRVRDARALKDALDMGYQIRGSYAPKKIDKRIGVWSMKELRDKMRKARIRVIEPEQIIEPKE